MSKKPLILITNDDGYKADGYNRLIKLMRPLGDVVAVSTLESTSAMGHAVTMQTPLRLNKIKEEEGYTEYLSNGTPADNIKLGKHLLLNRMPDLVVSGINHGSNAAINIIYSGTMAAALEAAMDGIPAIGFSVDEYGQHPGLDHTDEVILKITKKVLADGLPKGIALNVNIPKKSDKPLKGIKVCRQAEAVWKETYEERTDPFGRKYYWMSGIFLDGDQRPDTDEKALKDNYVAVVPSQVDFTATQLLNTLKF
jgi:5'-nucleotidase